MDQDRKKARTGEVENVSVCMCVCVIFVLDGLERQDTCSASFAVSPPSIVATNDLGQGCSTWYEGRKDPSLSFGEFYTVYSVLKEFCIGLCVFVRAYVILSGKSRILQGPHSRYLEKQPQRNFIIDTVQRKASKPKSLLFWDSQKRKLISCLTDKQDYWGEGRGGGEDTTNATRVH